MHSCGFLFAGGAGSVCALERRCQQRQAVSDPRKLVVLGSCEPAGVGAGK